MTPKNVLESLQLWASLGKQEGSHSTQTHLSASPDGSLVTVDEDSGMTAIQLEFLSISKIAMALIDVLPFFPTPMY